MSQGYEIFQPVHTPPPSFMTNEKPSHWLKKTDSRFIEAVVRHRAVVEGSGDLTAAKLVEVAMGFPQGAVIDEVNLHLERGTWAVVAIWEYEYTPNEELAKEYPVTGP